MELAKPISLPYVTERLVFSDCDQIFSSHNPEVQESPCLASSTELTVSCQRYLKESICKILYGNDISSFQDVVDRLFKSNNSIFTKIFASNSEEPLINKVFKFGQKVFYGNIPLYGGPSIASVLASIERSDKCDQRDESCSITLLGEAASRGSTVAVEGLLKAGADPDGKGINSYFSTGQSPLHLAISKSKVSDSNLSADFEKTIALLVDYGASVETRDKDGNLPIHKSTHSVNIAKTLIDNGKAWINRCNYQLRTALDIAECAAVNNANTNSKMVSFLKERGLVSSDTFLYDCVSSELRYDCGGVLHCFFQGKDVYTEQYIHSKQLHWAKYAKPKSCDDLK